MKHKMSTPLTLALVAAGIITCFAAGCSRQPNDVVSSHEEATATVSVTSVVPESSVVPEPSVIPEPSVVPEPSENSVAPKVSVVPEASENSVAPKASVVSEASKKSVAPKASVVSEASENSVAPKVSVVPEASENSVAPKVSVVPEASENSVVPKVSVVSEASENSVAPKVSVVPEASENSVAPKVSVVPEASENSVAPEVSVVPEASEEVLIQWGDSTLLIPRSSVEIRTLTPEQVEYVVLHNRTRGAITASPSPQASRGNLWAVSNQPIEVNGIMVAEYKGLFMKVARADEYAGILPEQEESQQSSPAELNEFNTRWAISSDNIDVYVIEDETTIYEGILAGCYIPLAEQDFTAHNRDEIIILWEGSKHGLIPKEAVQFIDRSLPITG